MSTTEKRAAQRGGAVHPDASESVQELDKAAEEEAQADARDREQRLWPWVEERNDCYVIELQHPLIEPPKSSPVPEKLRIRKAMKARDVRIASNAEGSGDAVFTLACLLSGIPEEVMDCLDAKDYSVVSTVVGRISSGNSQAVLRSFGGRLGS